MYVCVSYRYNSTRYIIIGTPYTYQKQVGTHELTTRGNHVYRLLVIRILMVLLYYGSETINCIWLALCIFVDMPPPVNCFSNFIVFFPQLPT